MRVKKFEAKNMKEALRMVKNELGPDAVILSARDNRKSFGIGGEASVEITAAVSESTLQKKRFVESRLNEQDRARFQSSDARTQRSFIDKMVEPRVNPVETKKGPRPITTTSYIDIPDEEIEHGPRRSAAMEKARGRNVRELLDGFEHGVNEAAEVRAAAARPAPKVPPPEGVSEKALARIREAAREAWKAGISTAQEEQARVVQAVQPQPSSAAAQPGGGGLEIVSAQNVAQASEIANLRGEIDRLHKVLEGFQRVPQSFVTMHPGADLGISYDLSFMFQKLVESGVNTEIAAEILSNAAKSIDPIQQKKRPVVDAWVARWILDHTRTVTHPWQGRLHLFVGGSGSGKTSSLVKMASQLVVKEKKRVAILTTDNYKVGAVDQLKIYCQILNVPFAVIRNRKDWEWILGQLANIDHVLVDFPGLNLRDLEEIHLMKSLLPPQEATPVCHLCVSATSKDGDAYEIARRYKVAEYGDLIFTNLDQSVQHGIIYNMQMKTGKPLHSFGIGPRIPEDFEPASKERVLDLIFKLTRLRRETK